MITEIVKVIIIIITIIIILKIIMIDGEERAGRKSD